MKKNNIFGERRVVFMEEAPKPTLQESFDSTKTKMEESAQSINNLSTAIETLKKEGSNNQYAEQIKSLLEQKVHSVKKLSEHQIQLVSLDDQIRAAKEGTDTATAEGDTLQGDSIEWIQPFDNEEELTEQLAQAAEKIQQDSSSTEAGDYAKVYEKLGGIKNEEFNKKGTIAYLNAGKVAMHTLQSTNPALLDGLDGIDAEKATAAASAKGGDPEIAKLQMKLGIEPVDGLYGEITHKAVSEKRTATTTEAASSSSATEIRTDAGAVAESTPTAETVAEAAVGTAEAAPEAEPEEADTISVEAVMTKMEEDGYKFGRQWDTLNKSISEVSESGKITVEWRSLWRSNKEIYKDYKEFVHKCPLVRKKNEESSI